MESNEWQSLGKVECFDTVGNWESKTDLLYKVLLNLPVFAIKNYYNEIESATLRESGFHCDCNGKTYNGKSATVYFKVPEELMQIKRMLSKQGNK